MQLARIGATPRGGVCRLALTAEDAAGRDQFVAWAREAGCTIEVDRIGNIFARRAGADPARAPVMTGSHLDTQPTGGKFDGNYGVLAGLEVVRTLNDLGIYTQAPIEIAVWTNEEGSRFVPVMMGSGVFTGVFALDEVLVQVDRDGISVRDALAAVGYAGEHAPGHPVAAYFEAHIEQGPVLEHHGDVIGAVTGALGQTWYDLEIMGMEAHAGPTPMETRRDALVVASRLVARVNEIALAHAPNARGTVGFVDVFPNSRNVIPGRVRMTVDFRSDSEEGLRRMDAELQQACRDLERPNEIGIALKTVVNFPPRPFDAGLVDRVREAARAIGLPQRDIVSGAAHDAVHLAQQVPAAMIFVPCRDGISHNEIEDAQPEHLEAGCNVLLEVMLQEAGIALAEQAVSVAEGA